MVVGAGRTAIPDRRSIEAAIDPSILCYLIEKEELPLNNLHAHLNHHSGHLGMSGYAADMRDLIQEAENAPIIREKTLANMEELGISLDTKKNRLDNSHSDRQISTPDSRVGIYVIPTNEERVIAQDTAKVATASRQSPWV